MPVYVDTGPPETLPMTIKRGRGSKLDFTTVTSVSLDVIKPNKARATWSTIIVSSTPTSVSVEHIYASGDLPVAGTYVIRPTLTIPGGSVRATKALLPVEDF